MILVADNLTVTDPRIENALADMDPGPIAEMAARCEAAGAQAIDINAGPLGKQPEEKMAFMVRAVQGATDLPLLLDTANPAAMEAGLASCRKRAVINGFSLEPMKIDRILPLAVRYDADIIGYLLDAESRVTRDAAERLSLALDIFAHAQNAGVGPERLIIDPVVVPLAWDDGKRQAMAVAAVIRQLPDVLGVDVRTIAGISNLTAGRGHVRERRVFEQAYLAMLADAGLSMALLNIFHRATVDVARACGHLKDGTVFAWSLNSGSTAET